ncbi:diguanylate cyclase (GGDEF)-like protein/PAS domain S-box-containing protein [Natronocella acetinitrilica]|uniref:diguanylate cyclase n=1 Tax=Natronocella acetinitrilica TaxID=414046 RepID=A0AAE3G6D6_9GAMM|nr:diguanylate cyclase [Natronocella acetinitrilica]MCP1675953.1 diguanylate cyclase (GGDEF)-like protein/PAS domain S-box-containing protein [Natronocella acetinitrilica]
MNRLGIRLLLIWLIAGVVLFVPFRFAYERDTQSHLDAELLQVDAALRSTEAIFRTVTNQAFSDLLGRDNFRQLLADIARSPDGFDGDWDRSALIAAGMDTHRSLRTCCRAELHVLTPDARSLIRFSIPGSETPPSAEYRPGLLQALEGRHGAQGFEMGLRGPAYRRILPIWDSGELVGAVEAELAVGDLMAFLRGVGGGALLYHLVLLESAVPTDNSNGLGVIYRPTALHEQIYEPVQLNSTGSRLAHWIEQSSRLRQALAAAIPTGAPASAVVEDWRGAEVAIAMLPIHDISGEQIGYAVAESDATALTALRNQYLWMGTLVWLLAAGLGTVALFLWHSRRGAILLQDKLAAVTESVGEGVFVAGDDGRIRYVNQAACDILGYTRAELLGANSYRMFHQLSDGKPISPESSPIRQATRIKGIYRSENEGFRTRSGDIITVSMTVTPLRRNRPSDGVVAVFHDVSARTRELTSLKVQALRDPLTGLANRRLFDGTLEREVRRSHRTHASLALLMVDVDDFKHYNDAFGHLAGDEALQRISKVLEECVNRPADLVCRYGGEEFALILPETDTASARWIAERVRHSVEAEGIRQAPGAVSEVISVSVGYASGGGPRLTAASLIAKADYGAYRAKALGRNRVEIGEPEPV